MLAGMNGVELFLLGRALMRIGEEAMPAPPGGAGQGSARLVLTVLSDIVGHPDSAIGEIAQRTGLPQSQVSTAVARLREAGSVETNTDPADRRRMLVRPARRTSSRVAQVRRTTIDAALTAALPDPADLADTLALLDTLAARLIPDVHSR
jgi:DNA-binding MarR family transcriptional regulator